MMALGWYAYKDIGGYYRANDKPKPGDPKPGELKIAGVTIPKYVVDAPMFGPLMVGATAHWAANKMVRGQPQGVAEGVLEGVSGPIQATPFVYTSEEINRLFTPPITVAAGSAVADIGIPGASSDIAKWMDQQNGETVKRTPHTFGEALMLEIPGLRQRVPETNTGRAKSVQAIPKIKFSR